jgi:hypothetical protein
MTRIIGTYASGDLDGSTEVRIELENGRTIYVTLAGETYQTVELRNSNGRKVVGADLSLF